MFFSFHDGSDLLIHEGKIHHLNTTAVVTFDPAGTPSVKADVDVVDVTAATVCAPSADCLFVSCSQRADHARVLIRVRAGRRPSAPTSAVPRRSALSH